MCPPRPPQLLRSIQVYCIDVLDYRQNGIYQRKSPSQGEKKTDSIPVFSQITCADKSQLAPVSSSLKSLMIKFLAESTLLERFSCSLHKFELNEQLRTLGRLGKGIKKELNIPIKGFCRKVSLYFMVSITVNLWNMQLLLYMLYKVFRVKNFIMK